MYSSYIITNSIPVISLVCFQPTRAVFGYEGNSNDLKVVETGGEYFIVIPSVYVESTQGLLLMTIFGNVVISEGKDHITVSHTSLVSHICLLLSASC